MVFDSQATSATGSMLQATETSADAMIRLIKALLAQMEIDRLSKEAEAMAKEIEELQEEVADVGLDELAAEAEEMAQQVEALADLSQPPGLEPGESVEWIEPETPMQEAAPEDETIVEESLVDLGTAQVEGTEPRAEVESPLELVVEPEGTTPVASELEPEAVAGGSDPAVDDEELEESQASPAQASPAQTTVGPINPEPSEPVQNQAASAASPVLDEVQDSYRQAQESMSTARHETLQDWAKEARGLAKVIQSLARQASRTNSMEEKLRALREAQELMHQLKEVRAAAFEAATGERVDRQDQSPQNVGSQSAASLPEQSAAVNRYAIDQLIQPNVIGLSAGYGQYQTKYFMFIREENAANNTVTRTILSNDNPTQRWEEVCGTDGKRISLENTMSPETWSKMSIQVQSYCEHQAQQDQELSGLSLQDRVEHQIHTMGDLAPRGAHAIAAAHLYLDKMNTNYHQGQRYSIQRCEDRSMVIRNLNREKVAVQEPDGRIHCSLLDSEVKFFENCYSELKQDLGKEASKQQSQFSATAQQQQQPNQPVTGRSTGSAQQGFRATPAAKPLVKVEIER